MSIHRHTNRHTINNIINQQKMLIIVLLTQLFALGVLEQLSGLSIKTVGKPLFDIVSHQSSV